MPSSPYQLTIDPLHAVELIDELLRTRAKHSRPGALRLLEERRLLFRQLADEGAATRYIEPHRP